MSWPNSVYPFEDTSKQIVPSLLCFIPTLNWNHNHEIQHDPTWPLDATKQSRTPPLQSWKPHLRTKTAFCHVFLPSNAFLQKLEKPLLVTLSLGSRNPFHHCGLLFPKIVAGVAVDRHESQSQIFHIVGAQVPNNMHDRRHVACTDQSWCWQVHQGDDHLKGEKVWNNSISNNSQHLCQAILGNLERTCTLCHILLDIGDGSSTRVLSCPCLQRYLRIGVLTQT